MSDDFITLTKIEVAERQLNQAIRLFFADEDPVSIRTLAEAAGEVMVGLGPYKGVIRDDNVPVPMARRDWYKKAFSARNYFKHADKDPEETLDFNPVSNEFVLLDAIMIYGKLKDNWSPETQFYYVWSLQAHGDLWSDESADKKRFNEQKDKYPLAKSIYLKYIEEMKLGLREL